MRNNRSRRKLLLTAETLRRLTQDELDQIAGGDTADGFCTDIFGCDEETRPIPIPPPSQYC
jgi:hypothetical protein